MHLRLSPKTEEKLRYLRLKYLPRTLFFRTMLLIFVPLIVVQIVSVVMFFNGSWSRMGRRLSENLSDDMLLVVDMVQNDVKKLPELQKLTKNVFDMQFEYYNNEQKHKVINKTHKASKMVIGYLEEALEKGFPDAEREVRLSKDNNDLIVMIDTANGLYKFVASKKKIFSSSIFMFVVWMAGTSVLLFLVAVMFLRI